MTVQFKIIHVIYHHNRGQFIAAQLLGNPLDREIKEGSLLGNIPVYLYKKMETIRDEMDMPQPDIYVFRPIKYSLTRFFETDQIIELTVAD